MPNSNKNPKGFIEILLVLGIAVMGTLLIGGLSTKNPNVSASDNTTYTIDENAINASLNNSGNNLQLKTFQGIKTTPPPSQAPVITPPPGPVIIPSSEPVSSPVTPVVTPPPNECQGSNDPLPVTNSCNCPQSLNDAVGCMHGSSACADKTTPPDWQDVTLSGVISDKCWFIKYNHGLGSVNPGYTKYLGTSGCVEECVGKPVIYLYPTKATKVDVKLTIPGYVYVSDPFYPEQTGWQNVEAHPDGTLIYQNQKYKELYYESAVNIKTVPESGVFIERPMLLQTLDDYLISLGLNETEKKEFFEYWMPKLNSTNSKYILFSVLTKEQKEAIDSVDIAPKPDTFIDFLVYFKPMNEKSNIKTMNLSQTPPRRVGFTAVEWGGTLDQN